MFPDELHTDRLYLRRPVESDAERIFARYGQDPRVCRYMSWTPHRSIDDTRTFLATIISDNAVRSRSAYLILSRENDELLGSVGGVIQDMRMQFGYCLAYDAWGKGYATEAARAFVAAAIQEPPIWRIQAFCDVENPASARVLEKAGLTLEGTLRRYLVMPNLGPMPRDMSCYAKVRQ